MTGIPHEFTKAMIHFESVKRLAAPRKDEFRPSGQNEFLKGVVAIEKKYEVYC